MDPKTTPPTPLTPDAPPEWRDPFCKPQTIPAGWEVSTLLRVSAPQAEDGAVDPEKA